MKPPDTGLFRHRLKYFLAILGFFFGALIVHPYVMIVYFFTAPQGDISISELLVNTFSSKMLPMTIAFSFFSMCIGFLLGSIYERNLRLQRLELEIKKRHEMEQAMNRLLSVLSHFVFNSTLIIKLSLQKLRRDEGPLKDSTYIDQIEREAIKNERAVKAIMDKGFLKELEEADTSISKILELTKAIEKRISP